MNIYRYKMKTHICRYNKVDNLNKGHTKNGSTYNTNRIYRNRLA